jgi:hypothetical protein
MSDLYLDVLINSTPNNDNDDDAPRKSNAQRFAQRTRQNVICLALRAAAQLFALRAAAQLFVTANNASWPKLLLDCNDPRCDYASAFIGNI